MYDLGRRVFVKAHGLTARIIERNWSATKPRHAVYVVEFDDGSDVMLGAKDLRAADYECDGCGEWRAGAPYASGPEGMAFCFLCAGPPVQEAEARARHAAELAWATQ